MTLRLTATPSAARATLASSLGTTQAFSGCGWFQYLTDPDAWLVGWAFHTEDGSCDFQPIVKAPVGLGYIGVGTAAGWGGIIPYTSAWVYAGFRLTQYAGTLDVYMNGTWYNGINPGWDSAQALTRMSVSGTAAGYTMVQGDGIDNLIWWDALVSKAEIEAQQYRRTPVRRANLRGWMDTQGGRLLDRVNDQALSIVSGGFADGSGPAVAMGAHLLMSPYAASLAQTHFRWRNDDGGE